MKAEDHSNWLLEYNSSWLSDVLIVKDNGEYSIIVTGGSKIKTYRGKLSNYRIKNYK